MAEKKLLAVKGFDAKLPPPPKTKVEKLNGRAKTLRKKHWCIIGVDISSSRLAMVALTDPLRALKVNFRTPWVPEVCAHAQAEAAEFVARVQNELDWNGDVWIEGALVGRNVQTTIVQSYVNGAVQAGVVSVGARVTLIQPSAWKVAVTGNGSADKAQVARRLRLRWPDHSKAARGDEDLVDAFAIAIAGALARGALGTPGAVSEVSTPVVPPPVQLDVSEKPRRTLRRRPRSGGG